MSRVIRIIILRAITGASLMAAAALTAGCGVEMGASYPGIAIDAYPPDGYIATTEPVYYEGRANYWYGGSWYYRDGNRWSHYDREPPALQQRRTQAAPARRSYEPARRATNTAAPPEPRRGGQR